MNIADISNLSKKRQFLRKFGKNNFEFILQYKFTFPAILLSQSTFLEGQR